MRSLKKICIGISFLAAFQAAPSAGNAKIERYDFTKEYRYNNTTDTPDLNPIPLLTPQKATPPHPVPTAEEDIPEIHYDVTILPTPVRTTRERIIEAAKTGDIEKLRPLLGTGDDETQISLIDYNGDPIAFLKELSGDGEGLEILAILIDLLNSGYAHLEQGSEQEIYVWPYFFAIPLDKLSKPQMVEAYQIMTSGDFETMKEVGTYAFFRIGISPDGKWRFFVTGD